MFTRAGGNQGHNDSFASTEVNNSAQAGRRSERRIVEASQDRPGVAVVSNGLSAPDRVPDVGPLKMRPKFAAPKCDWHVEVHAVQEIDDRAKKFEPRASPERQVLLHGVSTSA